MKTNNCLALYTAYHGTDQASVHARWTGLVQTINRGQFKVHPMINHTLYLCNKTLQGLSPVCAQTEEYISQQARIYGRDRAKVTRHQQQVNEATVKLALENPSLLNSRQKLLEEARKRDGYVHRKGRSQSIHLCDGQEESAPKQPKTSETFRLKCIMLEEDIKDFNDRLKFKEKRRDQANNSRS